MRSTITVLAALGAVALSTTFASSAEAHATGLSRGEYVVQGSTVVARLTFSRGELLTLVPALDADDDKALSAGELARPETRTALRGLFAKVALTTDRGTPGASPCTPDLPSARLEEEDGASVEAAYACTKPVNDLSVEVKWLEDVAFGHRHIAVVAGLGRPRDFIAFAREPSFEAKRADGGAVTETPKRRETFGGFFRLGIEHILTGYDHLLFLFALLLVGGRLRALLGVITAFTVAHSITLGLAALDIVSLSPAIVEPAIALSIAYVGVENFFVKSADRRYLLTFPFGLIHGFGFAGALSEIALPKPEVPAALLAFNLGVETGQLAVMAVVLPGLLFLRKKTWFVTHGVRILSGVVIALGLFWFFQRVFASPT
jgi:hydrogenase/urease accessory protein HupE